jgi:hypothetical protein
VRWAKPDLAWEFGREATWGAALQKQPAFFHSCGGAAAAAGGEGKAMRRLTDFDPPLVANCSDAMSCLDLWILSTFDSFDSFLRCGVAGGS